MKNVLQDLNFPPILCLWWIFAGSGLAQQTANDPQTPLIRVSSQFVVFDALVEDKKTGRPIAGLNPADFQVLEDGKPQSLSYFNHDQLPLSVVFLFDLTETVQPTLKPLALAEREVLGHLKPKDEVSVMVFSSHTTLLQGFTTDRDLASDAVERASQMKTGQGTFIHEDMYEAIDQALTSTAPESRRVMVWLTDGTANFENARTQKLSERKLPLNCTPNKRQPPSYCNRV